MIFGLGFIIGTILGSAVLAIAERSLANRTFFGRSSCPKCGHKLSWLDLLPVLSYLSLGGRCRYCKKAIGSQYLLVEAVLGALVGYLFLMEFKNPPDLNQLAEPSIFILLLILKTFFIATLSIVFITDLKKYLIPDRIIIPSIIFTLVLILIISTLDYFTHSMWIVKDLFMPLITGLGLGGFFLALILITKGKGMGGGDVKLGFLMGLVLGFPKGVAAVMLAFLLGSLYAVPLLLLGKKNFGESLAFGPFLVIGSLLMLFWGDQIISWYFNQHILTNGF